MELTLEKAKEIMDQNNGDLYLSGTQIASLPDNLTVGGSLDLRHTQIASLPDNLTVGGSLYLSGTQIASLPDNLTVGGSLDLSDTQIASLPDNLTVGGWLDLRHTQIKNKNSAVKKVHRLSNGEYKEGKYIYADRILTHIKRKHKINGYTYYYGKIKGKNVVSDGKNYAHCDSFRDGIADLLFKAAKDRGADQYKGIDMDKPIPLDDAKTMYRIITGACKHGTESFAESLGDKLKSEYTVREMLEVTSGAYGAEKFREFFES